MPSTKTFKDFLIHISIITIVFLFLGYLFFYIYLPSVTHHDEAILVPDLKGQTIEKSIEFIEKQDLQYKIFDSTYVPGSRSSTVINQFPKAGEKVKSNRTIYLTINTINPPEINMPNLIGVSYKSAEMTIKSFGLVLGEVKYKAGSSQGAVLGQFNSDNTNLENGKVIKKGTVINLLVSSGLGAEEITLPNVTGYSLSEAQRIIQNLGLEVGSVVYDDNSGQNIGMVFKQKPSNLSIDSTVKVKSGEIIDLWISGSK
ncbi:MAG: PASTA domain-containing protein [Bacteroidetes bacterium]|nr:MAG: PASTA domain-containing protein [Bacteroidota bacterium]